MQLTKHKCTVKCTPLPIARTSITAGTADSLMPNRVMVPSNCRTKTAKARVTNNAAQKLSSSTMTACGLKIAINNLIL